MSALECFRAKYFCGFIAVRRGYKHKLLLIFMLSVCRTILNCSVT